MNFGLEKKKSRKLFLGWIGKNACVSCCFYSSTLAWVVRFVIFSLSLALVFPFYFSSIYSVLRPSPTPLQVSASSAPFLAGQARFACGKSGKLFNTFRGARKKVSIRQITLFGWFRLSFCRRLHICQGNRRWWNDQGKCEWRAHTCC